MPAPAAVDDRILSTLAVCKRLGVGRTTVVNWRKDDPTFPRPLQLGPQRIGWRSADITAWLDARPTA